jgi:hypothetical protein
MRRDAMLLVGAGVVIGVLLSTVAFLSKPMPASAQSTTTPLPAPHCSVAPTNGPSGGAMFACAADLSGGGRQEIIVGFGPSVARCVMISGTGPITALNC